MNATEPLRVVPDIAGTLHVIFSPGNPLLAAIIPAPMRNNDRGKPTSIDIDKARVDYPNHYVVSYRPADGSSTVTPLSDSLWYTPHLFQQKLLHVAITKAMQK